MGTAAGAVFGVEDPEVKLRVKKPFDGDSGGSTVRFRAGRVIHVHDEDLAKTLIDSGMVTQELRSGELPLNMDDATVNMDEATAKKVRDVVAACKAKIEEAKAATVRADEHMRKNVRYAQQARDQAQRDRAMLRAAEKQVEQLNQANRKLKAQLAALPQTWQERLMAED